MALLGYGKLGEERRVKNDQNEGEFWEGSCIIRML
jgi:hypothetical protein